MRTVAIDGIPVGDGHPPRVMGVLNMSGESNYGPSVYPDPETAATYVEEMVEDGADIVDVGLQSANPKNPWLPESTESERLDEAVAVMEATDVDVPFSIETRYASVADEALASGFDMVNDVCGFADSDMPEVVEAHDVPVVKMASPPDVKRPGHLTDVDAIFEALSRGGFTDQTIIDPAFGGWYDERTYEDNWELFRRLREFRAFGRPILTATNREDFLGDIADRPKTKEQLPVSLAAATMEVERGAHIIRTHDVAETRDVIQVAHFLGNDGANETVGTETKSTRGNETELTSTTVTELTGVTEGEIARTLSLKTERSNVDSSESTTRAFQIAPLPEDSAESLADWAVDAGLLVAGGADDGLFLAGTTGRFRDALESSVPSTGEASTVIGRIRQAVLDDGD
ncbi:MAG: dihydropteroate synthase [Halodesulfurarchaeum sp.]